jgi:hypothetical protein
MTACEACPLQQLTNLYLFNSDAPYAQWPPSLRRAAVRGRRHALGALALCNATALTSLTLADASLVPTLTSLASLRHLKLSSTAGVDRFLESGQLELLGALEQLTLERCQLPRLWVPPDLPLLRDVRLTNCGS